MRTRVKKLSVIGVGGLIAVAMLWLGLWQMQVFSDQAAADSQARAELPALELDELLRSDTVADSYGRSVFTQGRWSDLRTPVAGPKVTGTLIGVKLASGKVVPVLVGACERTGAGDGRVAGVLLFSQEHEDARDGAELGSVRLPQLAQLWPANLTPGYIVADEPSAKKLGCESVEPMLPTGGGPWRNAGYALQWWVFAVFALGMSILIARRMD